MAYALGIDVSRWQGEMYWPKAYLAGARFAFIRSGSIDNTSGIPYTDYQFERNASIAPTFMPCGAYWYFRANHDPILQANYFCDLIGGKNFRLSPVVDVEESGGLSPEMVAAKLTAFLSILIVRTGFIPLIYTRENIFDPYVAADGWSQFGLWAARYIKGLDSPWGDGASVFRDWNEWTFWQFSADKDYNGAGQPVGNFKGAEFGADSTHIDLNYFNGDETALMVYAGITPPPVVEKPMLDVKTVSQKIVTGSNAQVIEVPPDEEWEVYWIGITTNYPVDKVLLEISIPNVGNITPILSAPKLYKNNWLRSGSTFPIPPGSQIIYKYIGIEMEKAQYVAMRYYAKKTKLVGASI